MRDVDLFVGVASVGNDATWSDSGGLPTYRDYWQSYSFGDLSEIAKNRKEIETILRLSGYGYDYFDAKEIETIVKYSQDLLVKICDEQVEEDEKKGVN